MNEEEIIDKLYPIMDEYYQEGTITGRYLMDYIKLFGQLKKLNPELAKGYVLENNAINVKVKDVCAICLEPMDSKQKLIKNENCQHLFHWDCFQGNGINKCPVCRAPFHRKMIVNERLYFGKTLKSDLKYLSDLC